MKHLLLTLSLILAFSFGMSAQMFTTSPTPLQESSKDVTITFHADKSGVAGLKGLSSGTSLYAHIGVYTNMSPGQWAHVVSDWGVNTPATEMKWVKADTYELTIGDLRSYFGITDPNETITKVCILARTPNAASQTSDQFIDVLPGGFQTSFTADNSNFVLTASTSMTFTLTATEDADLEITVDGSSIASATDSRSVSGSFTFTEAGKSWTVTGRATSNGETIEKLIEIVYPLSSPQSNYPGGVPHQGTVTNPDGSVTFCLAAPGKQSAILVGSWDDYKSLNRNVMSYQDYQGQRYFWITIENLKPSTPYPYYYLVDGVHKVSDPYAHLVLDCHSDKWLSSDVYPARPLYPYDTMDDVVLAVYQSDLDEYDWQVTDFRIPDHDNLIIYEILLRDFTGTDGNDDGTVRAAIERIPYLKSLGVNAVELMPIMEFNGNNSWGYNTNFYMAPDKSYGSPDDYKEFIDRCHANGIAVILDIVLNHSDGLHPWYQMYDSKSNPFYNATAPHDYSVLNDWKQEHPLVRQQWIDAITYWMTKYKVDGFRFDLVKGLGNSDSYNGDTEKYNQSRVDNMIALHSAIKAVNERGIHINENLAGAQEENAMAADGQLNWANKNGISTNYACGVAGMDLSSYLSTKDGNRSWASTVAYAESHDEQRVGYVQSTSNSAISRNLERRCLRQGSMAAQLLLTPGPKMIWQFAELCADENTKSADGSNNTNPKKVCWNYLDNADRHALYTSYCELIDIRLSNPELFTQDATFETFNFQSAVTPTRTMRLSDGKKEIIVFINSGINGANNVNATASIITPSNARCLSHSPGFTPILNASGNSLTVNVPAHSYAVFASDNTSGIDEITSCNDIKVIGGIGEITIIGDYSQLVVSDIAGRVYPTTSGLAKGIYIVVVDGVSHRTIVK